MTRVPPRQSTYKCDRLTFFLTARGSALPSRCRRKHSPACLLPLVNLNRPSTVVPLIWTFTEETLSVCRSILPYISKLLPKLGSFAPGLIAAQLLQLGVCRLRGRLPSSPPLTLTTKMVLKCLATRPLCLPVAPLGHTRNKLLERTKRILRGRNEPTRGHTL